ncbi:hypothetical protein SDC9_180563 [bioreactor metagenome]|uniref:Uncharacterized protein n=1 Tax=bioreactor metagenome TaxID=1076179 RepID=A0A645H310_9ZZZZ
MSHHIGNKSACCAQGKREGEKGEDVVGIQGGDQAEEGNHHHRDFGDQHDFLVFRALADEDLVDIVAEDRTGTEQVAVCRTHRRTDDTRKENAGYHGRHGGYCKHRKCVAAVGFQCIHDSGIQQVLVEEAEHCQAQDDRDKGKDEVDDGCNN